MLTDVTNGLLGPTGAAAMFGPQKGFSPSDIIEVDKHLAHFASLLPPSIEATYPELLPVSSASSSWKNESAVGVDADDCD